ncbi:MAG: hypothetical protein M1414_03810 [Candidatus Thermoplasmatota archaeon]|nr:hypothetical protein [Candidatus Thermoplasmatota archaeon]MCL5988015.1 hypothetical protein [Candidatus Thermoplasmatota archaeon]
MDHKWNESKEVVERLGFLALGAVILILPNGLYSDTGYTSFPSIILELFAYIVGFLIILYALISPNSKKDNGNRLVFIMLASMGTVTLLYFFYGIAVKHSVTDETFIDMTAAKNFLAMINPYGFRIPISTFNQNGVPLSYLTPTLAGGFVNTLGYPSLSFLMLVPIVLLHLNPVLLTVLFSSLLLFTIGLRYMKSSVRYASPLAISISLLNLNVIFFSLNGINDVVWAEFLALSIIFINRKYAGGLFFGLSLAYKQVPVFLMPFFMVYLLKTHGWKRMLQFVFSSIVTFLIFNLPFIIWSPSTYFSAVLSPESTSLLGIGFGPSQLAFAGYLPFVGEKVFQYTEVAVFIILILLYYINFQKLKYVMTALPLIFFLFNYRLLENYVLFWPILSLLIIPQIIEDHDANPEPRTVENKNVMKIFTDRRKTVISAALVILLVLVPISASMVSMESYNPSFTIISVSGKTTTTELQSMTVEVQMKSPVSNGTYNFRVLTGGPLFFPNGYLWNVTSLKYMPGNTVKFHIQSYNSTQGIVKGKSYILEIYSVNSSGWIEFVYNGNNVSFNNVQWY